MSKNFNDGRCILVNKLLTLLKQVKIDFTKFHITRQETMMKNLKVKQDIPLVKLAKVASYQTSEIIFSS